MTLASHDRYDYSAVTDRPAFLWPEGRRLAVYLGVNFEHFAFGEGRGAQIGHAEPPPDVLNYGWRDYGNRVGAWRLIDLLDALDLPATVLPNSAMYDYAPDLMAAHHARGDEIAGHGRTNSESQSDMSEGEEAAMIAEATAKIAAGAGMRPKGWLSPWIAETEVTPDLLVEAGYSYTMNWCMDDQPVWMRTRSGPLLAMPYGQEINDIPAIVGRKTGAAEFADMIIDNFDELLDQSEGQSLVFGIALHPYIVGQPFRLRQLRRALRHIARHRDRVWLTTAGEIAEAFAGQVPPDRS
ncbi:Polysaccharide deacetylase [Loktanella atrilutea]|uniref:Chitooligosaccharide deacetylase n=1 Tax=Loktanella atrilutea TaxID=366533 RepID=A0A1M5BSM0_LOKAT|nr:polysaccharide deacetylase family protein [Loktanella atrilutea]SHF45242.1 Polysaccharide deacetylase [Loktanella atrilutea]